jgi:hypothetical protein
LLEAIRYLGAHYGNSTPNDAERLESQFEGMDINVLGARQLLQQIDRIQEALATIPKVNLAGRLVDGGYSKTPEELRAKFKKMLLHSNNQVFQGIAHEAQAQPHITYAQMRTKVENLLKKTILLSIKQIKTR